MEEHFNIVCTPPLFNRGDAKFSWGLCWGGVLGSAKKARGDGNVGGNQIKKGG